jgi:PAS domain S-box-containing protein
MSYLIRFLGFLKNYFIPPNSDNDDQESITRILLLISSALLGGLILLLVYRVIVNSYSNIASFLVTGCAIILVIYLIRHHFISLSANLLLWSLVCFDFYIIWHGDGIHDSAMIAFPGTLIIAGLVLRKKYFYIFMSLSITAVIIFGVLEVNGVVKNQFSLHTSYRDVMDVAVIFILTVISIRLLIHNLTQNLFLARSKEEEATTQLKENILIVQALKSAKDAISITDMDDNIIFANDAFRNIYGYTDEELTGGKISMIRPSDFSPELSGAIYEQTFNEGWHGEVVNRNKKGDSFLVELWTSLVKDTTGKQIARVGFARDITDRKKSEKELIEAKEKAEEMNRLKTNFLFNMSHELRTPLVGILGFAQILEEETTDSTRKEMVNMILTGARRLSVTLNQLLDLAKIESNRASILWKKLNLINIISDTIKVHSDSASKKQLKISSVFSPGDFIIMGDERMLFNIFDNLINNAIKFTYKGEIIIDVSVWENETNPLVVVKIIDTGIGISEDKLELIFEEFRQASEGLGRGFEGTGLGLTITKKYVEFLKGKIEVHSKQGMGSTFTVSFPLFRDLQNNTLVTE